MEALQTFQQNLYDVSRRTREVGAQVYGNWGRYRLSGNARFTDTFTDNAVTGEPTARRDGLFPQINFGIAEKPIGHSPVYFGATTDFVVVREQHGPERSHTESRAAAVRRQSDHPRAAEPLAFPDGDHERVLAVHALERQP